MSREGDIISNQELLDLKEQIKIAIRRNSDRGFVPYSGCNRVCVEIQAVMNVAERYAKALEYQQAFKIYIMVLLETVKLVSHADDSGGGCGDIIHFCLEEIDVICKNVAENGDKKYFDTLIKTAKNKAFEDWAEWAYWLLKSAVYFVSNEKEAGQIYDLFPALGGMYSGEDYPDKLFIILGITERLHGKEAARKYLFDNLDLDEFRKIAVEEALSKKDFFFAEQLCLEALAKNDYGYYGKPSQWAYFLEQIYEATNNTDSLIATVRGILFKGDKTYFRKLKALYEQQGVWEREQIPLWQELPKKIASHYYIALLSQEDELELLLEAIRQQKYYISEYGKQLATQYPDETNKIFEEYILSEASPANTRGKYRQVCAHLKSLAGAGAKEKALELIEHLCVIYPRRPAMLEELAKLKQKLSK